MPTRLTFKKLGLIFDLDAPEVRSSKFLFSQSPQAIELDDRVRVYFCSRKQDNNNTFKSYAYFAEFTKDLTACLGVSSKPVVELGGLGTFDEHGIFPFSPMYHDNVWTAYTCGWSRRESVSVETAIGYATSQDSGLTFEKLGPGPIVAASLREPYLVGDAFVRYFEGQYHMWYMFGTNWQYYDNIKTPERTYKIGHSTSPDGIHWEGHDGTSIIPDKLNENESIALPSVMYFNGKYHMCFCYRESNDFRAGGDRGYKIGYAHSKDLTTWQRDDDLLQFDCNDQSSHWDNNMQCYPNFCIIDGVPHLFYNGNEFGKYGFGVAKLILSH
ncbi:hypothetical protein N9L48_00970 [Psychrosphaera sp.]|nr:hypothetical protein [Psychrosphaera sp.]